MQRATSIDLGPYQLRDRIGEGGNGQVYRANGPTGTVAVKLLGPAADLDDAARARFRREIAALAALSHPNLVPLLDHGIDPELGPYLVLPLLAGTHLRELSRDRALCPEAALLLLQPIAAAIAALHERGYVHRDLKPENAIASPDGAVVVIDLGLAWAETMTRHTETGTAVGSIGYMAPEQLEGRGVEPRTDVWALGVMIYEWITGRRPFARSRPTEEVGATLLGAYSRLTAADRRADDALADLVGRCLSADPARRPSAAELAAAIDAMIDWAPADQLAAERAAVIADPVGYQARISAFRTRRLERLAREAIDAGKPFVALTLCDRGLAYLPDHPPLVELIARAEAATARPADDRAALATAATEALRIRGPRPAGSDHRASDRAASDRPADHRAADHRASDHRAASDRASDHAASDRAADRAADRASDHRASDRASDHRAASDRAASDHRTSDRASSSDRTADHRATGPRASDRAAFDHPDADHHSSASLATAVTAPSPVATATTAPSPVATATTAPSPVATTTTSLRRHRRAIAIAVGCLIAGAAATAGIIALVERPADPWRAESKAQEVAARPAMDDRDRALFHDFVGLFGVLAERTQPGSSNGGPSPLSGAPPTTARGWLELSERQPPAEAIASLRQALALNPGWPEAENALCIALSNAEDDGAVPVCDAALRRQPYTLALLAARATAQMRAGQPASAIADLDRVIAGDPAPKWRRLRAQARTAAGDQEGARRDLEQACQLGDAPSCRTP